MWLDVGLAFQKVQGKLFLSVDLTLSPTLLNTDSGDADLGHCNHQLTFSGAQIKHNWGMKVISLPTADVSQLDEINTSTTLDHEWVQVPLTNSTLCL